MIALIYKKISEYGYLSFISFFIALTGGIIFACIIPIGRTDDEYAHVPKAYSVSEGQILPEKIGSQTIKGQIINYYGGYVPTSLYELEEIAVAKGIPASRCQHPDTPLSCGELPNNLSLQIDKESRQPIDPSVHQQMNFGGASNYIFLPYIPAAIGMKSAQLARADVGAMIVTGRIFSVLCYSLILAFTLYLLRDNRAKWIILGVGLLPQSIVTSASIGVDMLLNALSLLLFALIVLAINNKHALNNTLKVLLVLIAVTLPLLKLPYLVLSFAVLFLPIYSASRRYAWIQRISLFSLILLVILCYTLFSSDIARSQALMMYGGSTPPNTMSQLSYVATHPFDYLKTLADSFFQKDWVTSLNVVTHQKVPLPTITLIINALTLIFAGIFASSSLKVRNPLKYGVSLVVLGAIASIGIVTALYAAYTSVGAPYIEGVQGRYFIPCIAFIGLGVGIILNIRLHLNKNMKYVYIATLVSSLIISTAYYWKVINY